MTGLPIMTLTALDANDSNSGTQTGDLVINYGLAAAVADHYGGQSLRRHRRQTGVERINFNSATFDGYLLGADDYLVSRLDPNNRDSGGVNLSPSTANNFIVGENGVNDVITGGGANDLIFGGTGDNDLVGGLGDDLLVGGTGNDDLDARTNGDIDNLDLTGALTPTRWSAGPATTFRGGRSARRGRGSRKRRDGQSRDRDGRALDRAHGQRRKPHIHSAATPTSSSVPATSATT